MPTKYCVGHSWAHQNKILRASVRNTVGDATGARWFTLLNAMQAVYRHAVQGLVAEKSSIVAPCVARMPTVPGDAIELFMMLRIETLFTYIVI